MGQIITWDISVVTEFMFCINLLHSFCNHLFSFNAVDSVAQAFNNCLTSMSDFKELTPEFYESNGEFLQNTHRIKFGTKQNGQAVNDVELPPWAKSKSLISVIVYMLCLMSSMV